MLGARADPAVPLHVLRVRGRLVEVRAADLAFTEPEAAALFEAHGVDLAPELVAALCARTEGWGAGLRLAAHSLQGRDDPERFVREFAGDDRVVGDYLLAEVLDRQPPRLRSFLLRTSIVDRVCGDLADALTTQGSSSDILVELERTNGFVLGVDSRREWFRYHLLFAKLLRTRAARELGDELPRLHDRAARWYAAHGMGSQALQHAVAASDWDLAVELVAEHWFDLFVRGQGGAIRRLVDVLPADRQRGDAELAAALACAAFEVGDGDAGAAHLEHARAAEAGLPAERRRRYLETLALARLYGARLRRRFRHRARSRRRAAGRGRPARRLVRRRPRGARARVSRTLRAVGVPARPRPRRARAGHRPGAGRGPGLRGRLGPERAGPARRSCSTARSRQPFAREAVDARRAPRLGDDPRDGGRARRTGAERVLRPASAARPKGISRGRATRSATGAPGTSSSCSTISQARMAGAARPARGGPAGARTRIEVTHRRGKESPYERAALASMRARLLAAMGDLEAARETLAPARADGWLDAEVTAARLQLAGGDPGRRDRHPRALGGHDRRAHRRPARARRAGGDRARHRRRARPRRRGDRARARAWPRRPAIAGRSSKAAAASRRCCARSIRSGTAHRAIVGELLAAFEDRDHERRTVAPLLEPLSERECAILRYLPTTLSNREIAAELFVTTNTVKTHLRSIYRKLDVARRREAVERARDLRLLSASRR